MKGLRRLMTGTRPATTTVAETGRTPLEFEGVRKAQGAQAKNRMIIAIACFGVFYAAIGARLVDYGMRSPETVSSIQRPDQLLVSRPDLSGPQWARFWRPDIRHGCCARLPSPKPKIIPMPSPRTRAIELLATVLSPDLDMTWASPAELIHPIPASSGSGGQLTPKQQSQILARDPRHRIPVG